MDEVLLPLWPYEELLNCLHSLRQCLIIIHTHSIQIMTTPKGLLSIGRSQNLRVITVPMDRPTMFHKHLVIELWETGNVGLSLS
jgi:hypothetical protein